MDTQIQQISRRIKELREILEVGAEEVAARLEISVEQYNRYEEGLEDIPVGVIYGVAAYMHVDPTVLLTGESPRMNSYTIVRQGNGVRTERYKGYSFTSLAFNYIGRDMEPMLVNIDPSDDAELVTHGGQEFNYVLQGRIGLTLGAQQFILEAGDSCYFDPSIPHGQKAIGGHACFLTLINE